MKQSFVDINGIPTMVTSWGGHVNENLNSKEIVICMPGNPGLSGYYYKFLEIIHNKLNIPVWIIAHSGHEEPQDKETLARIPELKGNEKLYDTFGQIEHKAEFIRKYVPKDVKIHMIGHSIGTYIILQLLKKDDIKSKIKTSSMLFPTIYNLLYTPLGVFFIYLVKPILAIVIFITFLFSILPQSIAVFLVYLYFTIIFVPKKHINEIIPFTIDMIKPHIIRKVFHLGFDEIMTIKDIEIDVINNNKDKLKFYFGTTDFWVPKFHYKKLIKACPNVDAQLCEKNFNHAFVLKYPEEVGEMVADWIINWKHK